MGVIRREGAVSSVVIYLGIVFGFFQTLYIYPKYLNPEEIGLVRVFVDMAGIIVPFLLLGVQNTYVKYYPYFKDSKDQSGVFRLLSVLIPGIGTLLSLFVFYLARPWIISSINFRSPLLADFIDWLPLLIFLIGGMKLIRAYYRSDLNITVSNVYESFVLRGLFIASVILYTWYNLEIQWLIYMYLLSHSLVLIAMIISYRSYGNLYLSFKFNSIDKSKRWEIFYYGIFVIANVLSGSTIVKIDTWMISSMAGLSATGVYAIAIAMGNVIELPRKSITQISVPVIANAWRNGNMDTVKEIFHKTALNQMIAGGMIFILIWINIEDLFNIIPNGSIFKEGIWVVFFIGLSKLFAIATGVNNEILQISNHYRYSLWIRILLVVTAIATNYYLIPIYGITGAAIATAISILSNNILLFIFVWFKLDMQPFNIQNLYAVLWLAVLFGIGYLIPSTGNAMINIGLRTVVIGGAFSFIMLRMNFSQDIKEFMLMGLKKIGIRL